MEERDIQEDTPLQDESAETPEDGGETAPEGGAAEENALVRELNDKYVRLYAEFDNYRKRVSKDREELVKYANESLLYELLPAIDHLELALKHAAADSSNGLVQGVEITLRELQRTLEKFGLTRIEAAGKCFDPSVHHAMMQVERQDMDERMVAEELRSGYRYRDKVLRPSLVAVSVKPGKKTDDEREGAEGPEDDERSATEDSATIEIDDTNDIQEEV